MENVNSSVEGKDDEAVLKPRVFVINDDKNSDPNAIKELKVIEPFSWAGIGMMIVNGALSYVGKEAFIRTLDFLKIIDKDRELKLMQEMINNAVSEIKEFVRSEIRIQLQQQFNEHDIRHWFNETRSILRGIREYSKHAEDVPPDRYNRLPVIMDKAGDIMSHTSSLGIDALSIYCNAVSFRLIAMFSLYKLSEKDGNPDLAMLKNIIDLINIEAYPHYEKTITANHKSWAVDKVLSELHIKRKVGTRIVRADPDPGGRGGRGMVEEEYDYFSHYYFDRGNKVLIGDYSGQNAPQALRAYDSARERAHEKYRHVGEVFNKNFVDIHEKWLEIKAEVQKVLDAL
ncbi:MAG: hypothetical protein P1V18_00305 [Candidatus Gracilibacteria bacterium]|nr:hypothetical protein [Candidatus Gracilibacteria bacterium]